MKPDAYIAERGSEAITQLSAEQDKGAALQGVASQNQIESKPAIEAAPVDSERLTGAEAM